MEAKRRGMLWMMAAKWCAENDSLAPPAKKQGLKLSLKKPVNTFMFHLSPSCPATKPFTNRQHERVHHHGTINGVYSKEIVVDTGAGKNLVRGDFITHDDIIDGEVTIQCAHGDVVSYPLAAGKITLGGKEIIVHVAVVKSLPGAAILGWDVTEIMGLVKPTPEVHSDATKVLAVVTRNQEKAKDLPSPVIDSSACTNEVPPEDKQPNQEVCPQATGDQPFTQHQDDDTLDRDPNPIREEIAFDDAIFSPPGPAKQILTHSQKCAARRQHADPDSPPLTAKSLDVTAEQLCQLQQPDNTLESARAVTDGGCSTEAGPGFSSEMEYSTDGTEPLVATHLPKFTSWSFPCSAISQF